MVIQSKPVVQSLSCTSTRGIHTIPVVDISQPESKYLVVKACEKYGFFKVINHGIPVELMSLLENQAMRFFALPVSEKAKARLPPPFGYGNRRIGQNGDIGWIEYLLLTANLSSIPDAILSLSASNPGSFRAALEVYIGAVRAMACRILEMVADGLRIQQTDVFSKLLMDEQSDSVFRLNYYPRFPDLNDGEDVIGFGEHTDPQIISVLRSNDSCGLQISVPDGSWVSVPPDKTSFFINVGDSLQVMTNGRFKSVKHRVLANTSSSRLSMIFFGGPPLRERIAPLRSLMRREERSLYREFTWFEYKKSVYNSKLSHNKLVKFERVTAS